MARVTKKQQRRQRLLRRAFVLLTLAGLVALAVVGWRWQATLPLDDIDVAGVVHADTAAVLDLAAVPDSAMLYSLDTAILEDRVRRHPWVEDASVTRWMTGTLGIRVIERTPAALVLDNAGRPDYFFDAAGFMMPAVAADPLRGVVYDVPLLQGRFGDYRPTQPVEDEAVRALLAALATAPSDIDALVSSVERRRDGSFVLHTAATPAGGSIPVALGRDGFVEKLGRLHAFWDQAILTRPATPVRRIDLRFDGQIITEE